MPPYNGAFVSGFYDLSDPQNPTSFTVEKYTTAPLTTARAYSYEHVYENQMMTMFINDVIVPFFASVYNTSGCSATQEFVFRPWDGRIIANDLRASMPGKPDTFPKLNQVANMAKAAFISGKAFITTNNLQKNKNASQIVYYLRQAALSIYYMQDITVERDFLAVSQAVRVIWIDFMGKYVASQPPGAVNFDIANAYDTWIEHILGNYSINALSFIHAALPILQNKFNGSTSITVNTPLPCSSHTEIITYQQMVNAFADGGIPYINWTP
ncbi:hypothetical protein EW026_g3002 [Hermanssonia centrifuga]|uniref:Uncharacterized protein n=1 Tax=Hermanssonia centrifuga TaxID=98765 RepID=A0A4S4KLG9_9APHY|nr:hypothetical protein EW026_g3002 [Hermanssonia centrifuga]